MAETKQDEAEPAVNTGTPADQPPPNNANNAPSRDHDVLQEVLTLLSAPPQENTGRVHPTSNKPKLGFPATLKSISSICKAV